MSLPHNLSSMTTEEVEARRASCETVRSEGAMCAPTGTRAWVRSGRKVVK